MFLSHQYYFKQRATQVKAQFRFAFPQRSLPSKIVIQKNVLKYGTCLNLDYGNGR